MAEEAKTPLSGGLRVSEPPAGAKAKGGIRKQYIAAISANLAAVACGAVTGWSSPALARMSLSEAEKSWAGSLVALGAALGPWVGGWAADRLGRRCALLWSLVPLLVGWGMLMAAENIVWLLYLSRVVLGLAVGVTFAALPMYVGETAQAEVRGALGSLLQLCITVGMLLMYVVGPYVSYLVLAIIGVATAVLFACTFYWRAESPYQLLSVGNDQAAEKALKAFRGDGEDITDELKEMQDAIEESKKNKASIRDLVATRGNVRALYLSLGLASLQQFSGINAVLFFGEDIFRRTGSGLDSSVSQIIVGAVMVAASCVTPLVVDRLGRRILLLASGAGMCLAQVALGVFFTLADAGSDVSALGWLPVTSLVVYIAVYSPGFGALPWAVMGELFPTNVKSVASSLTASVCWFLGFLITKFFSDIAAALGNATPFWFFAVCCVIADIFVFFLLPETKGRTLEEIQTMLNKR